jgi:hypothetical protein
VNFAQGYLLGRPVLIDELEGQSQSVRSRQDAAYAAALAPASFLAGSNLT